MIANRGEKKYYNGGRGYKQWFLWRFPIESPEVLPVYLRPYVNLCVWLVNDSGHVLYPKRLVRISKDAILGWADDDTIAADNDGTPLVGITDDHGYGKIETDQESWVVIKGPTVAQTATPSAQGTATAPTSPANPPETPRPIA